ncbi:MAG: DoxX family protein [Candidatus Nanopelagicales bacterium]
MPTLTKPGRLIAGAFLLSGTVHLVRPQVFEPLIPPALPSPRSWVVGSGVAEIACGVGLLARQPWAPRATAATLLAVWPGNAWHAMRTQQSSQPGLVKAAVWARLPLQVPLIAAALRAYR